MKKYVVSRVTRPFVSAMMAGMAVAVPAQAEDLKQIFEKATQYYEQKNYGKALEELSWAQKEIEKANNQVTQSFFPDSIEGYSGGKVESASVFGISNIERTYSKSGSSSIKVALTGSSKGQGQNPLGGIAALGQMAAMMGGQPGTESFRIDGRTATLETQESSASLTIFLEGGSMLKLEMTDDANGELLKKFASSFKIADIEKHLKG